MESKIRYLLSGPLSSPQTETDGIDVLHMKVMGMKDTNIAQFWDVEFTGITKSPAITKFANTDDQQFLTAYLKSSVCHGNLTTLLFLQIKVIVKDEQDHLHANLFKHQSCLRYMVIS